MTPRQRSTAASRQERRDNLRNLMALFEAMGATCATLPSGRRLRRSLSWPHRLWLDLDDHAPMRHEDHTPNNDGDDGRDGSRQSQ